MSGTEITESQKILERFLLLPKLYAGKEVEIDFYIESVRRRYWWEVPPEVALALSLDPGTAMRSYTKLNASQNLSIYANGELALELIETPPNSQVRAKGVTAFALVKDVDWGEEGPITRTNDITGVLLTEILSVTSLPENLEIKTHEEVD